MQTAPTTSKDAGPAFYLDLASPECWLVAERILTALPGPCEWVPVHAAALGAPSPVDRDAIVRRAAELGLQPMRWPEPFPFDADLVLRAATYAKSIGRAVAFTQAALRQAYAGGRDLSVPDHVLIAGAACEMHPSALLKAVQLRSVRAALDAAGVQAASRGVRSVPAIWTGREVVHGEAGLDEAAVLMGQVAAS